MHRLLTLPLVLTLLLSAVGCGSRQEQRGQTIPPPEAPLTTAREQARNYLDHYWDHLNLEEDTTLMAKGSILYAMVRDYCGLLSSFPANEVEVDILKPLKRSHQRLLPHILERYRHHLYTEADFYNSEEHYSKVLNWVISSAHVPQHLQERAKADLEMVNKNRVGTPATDFIYTLPDSTGRRLSYLNSPYNMLIFATPGCPSCAMVLENIIREMKTLVESKQLHILVVYLMVNDPDEVRMHAEELPKWIEVGYDAQHQILGEKLYDIKQSPSIYLLDRQRRVLLKDTNTPRCYNYIMQQTNKTRG